VNQHVATRIDGDVAIVTLDNPPVNALSHHLREALHGELARLSGEETVRAIVIACAGRTFVSGADITEFNTPKALASPSLRELCAMLDEIEKPTVAAIHGTALGGGLELALACHYRVAARDAQVGLPEVKLGLLPGAGGTARLPRVTGPEAALDMIVSGSPVPAPRALELGVVDAVAEGELLAEAIVFARAMADRGGTHVPVSRREDRIAPARQDIASLDRAIARHAKKARGLDAPRRCAQAVRDAVTMSFEDALKAEREAFDELVDGVQSRAQRHLFFAQREAAKVPGIGKDIAARDVRRVGIIGAGTMGGGIAMAFANAGMPVTLVEAGEDALARGLATIERNYATSVARGSITQDESSARLARLQPGTDYGALGECDLIIEAVFEEMSVKKEVFARIEAVARPGAVLATNTSYLDVDAIAAGTGRPGDVVGLHFFSPANVMKLLEIVRGKETAPDVIATALAVARRIGKVPVVVGVCHGFVGNRMLEARSAENEALLMEGASPRQIDEAFVEFGWPMGPFQMADLAGLDIGWRKRKALGTSAAIADRLCEQGRFGQKTGRGYYIYEEGSRTPVEDPEVIRLAEEAARERGIARREIGAKEVIERTHYPLVNEGARILEERIASRPSDIDIVWTNGYGFPIGKGGPMFWADVEGLPKIVERLDHWHSVTGVEAYDPAASLRRLAGTGGSFSARPSGG
jgi:3-hydroxyacyl-CoA dehydrogenase